MTEIIHSVKPELCEKIISGDCSILITKLRPKIQAPFKNYIYCTSVANLPLHDYVKMHNTTEGRIDNWHGKVIGECICDKIYDISAYNEFYGICGVHYDWNFDFSLSDTCLTEKEFEEYFSQNINGYIKPLNGYGWHITGLKIYDTPKELSEFCTTRVGKSDGCWDCINSHKSECQDCRFNSHFKKQIIYPHKWCYTNGVIG